MRMSGPSDRPRTVGHLSPRASPCAHRSPILVRPAFAMPLPEVAIVGRPNVGKSTLLNALVGKRVSIVDATAGTTRDRVAARVDAGKRSFEAVDTGGIGIVDEQDVAMHVEAQIAVAIERAAKIAFVVDAAEGLHPLDLEVAKRLRRSKRPI